MFVSIQFDDALLLNEQVRNRNGCDVMNETPRSEQSRAPPKMALVTKVPGRPTRSARPPR